MTEVAERHYLDERGLPPDRISGLAVTRHGYARPTRHVRMIEAGHPVPDAAGLAATLETLALADAAGPDDLVLVLMSGGASANWIAPAAGLSLAEKQALTRALLASGASIGEINTVRKHLSRIKGGRLAERISPARLVTIAISDVPGDDPAVIGSGPTVPIRPRSRTRAPSSRATASTCRTAVARALADPANETPKPGDAVFAQHLVRAGGAAGRCVRQGRGGGARRRLRLHPARHRRRGRGARRSPPSTRGSRATCAAQGRRAVILSGGELTVTLRGKGRGGPNQEYALALAIALDGDAEGSRRWPATPTAPTAAAGMPSDPAAPSSTRRRLPGRARLASIRPLFLTTIIRPNSLKSLAIF